MAEAGDLKSLKVSVRVRRFLFSGTLSVKREPTKSTEKPNPVKRFGFSAVCPSQQLPTIGRRNSRRGAQKRLSGACSRAQEGSAVVLFLLYLPVYIEHRGKMHHICTIPTQ